MLFVCHTKLSEKCLIQSKACQDTFWSHQKDVPKNSKPFIDPQDVKQPKLVPAIPESALERGHLTTLMGGK